MDTDPLELLERFSKDLPNLGKWHWDDARNGSKARTLTVVHKLLKAGVSSSLVRELVTDIFFTAYVEYERQILAKTGVVVKELRKKSITPTTADNIESKKVQDADPIASLS